jgi:uncharacterized repeat protein (TIGR01451 family)
VETASQIDLATIQVTVPQTAQISVDGGQFGTTAPTEILSYNINGTSLLTYVGQFTAAANGGTPFNTFCIDIAPGDQLTTGSNVYTVQPQTDLTGIGGSNVQVGHSSEIAYLYNTFGTGTFTGPNADVDSAALQVAIWSLEYNATPSVLDSTTQTIPPGNFFYLTGPNQYTNSTTYQAVVAQAETYVSDATGNSSQALFLAPTGSVTSGGPQGLIAPVGSYNFVDALPTLNIVKTVTANQTVIHPGDTASFTITVSNTGAGTANNVVMTDNLPDASQLTWTVTSFTGFTSASINSGVLTASEASMPGGGTASVVVSAVVPLNFFGTSGGGTGNGDPVPLSLFELDGNGTTGVLGTSGSTTPSHDWDQVYADDAANPKTNTAGAIASSFVNDPINTTKDDIFTGGGSKDPNAISQWQFKSGKPQGKDDIENAFAALYKDPSTSDQILYAGLTRFDDSGDATAGFWFFVNPISENANGTFSGTHTDGDILLVSDFTIAGSVSTIKVFEWKSGNLVLLNNGNLPSGTTFAIVNGAPISVPWTYVNKSGAHQPDHGEFLEEGINLTGLGLNGCFSTFLAETRSSQAPTATLSDLVLGNLSTCDVNLPNQASVSATNFNNGQPITSNIVAIDINDGDDPRQSAASLVSGAVTTSHSLSRQVGANGGVNGSAGIALANLSSLPPALSEITLSLGGNSSSNGSSLSTWNSAVLGALSTESHQQISTLAALNRLFIDLPNHVNDDPLDTSVTGPMEA